MLCALHPYVLRITFYGWAIGMRISNDPPTAPGYFVAAVGVMAGGACPVARYLIAQASCESAQLACPAGGCRSATQGTVLAVSSAYGTRYSGVMPSLWISLLLGVSQWAIVI